MSFLLSRWLAAPATALRAALVLGLAVSTLAACGDSPPPTSGLPVARNVTLETAEDTSLEVRLQASGDGALAFTLVDAPKHGTLSELSAEGVATYTPSANYHGQDALTFRVTDSKGQSAQGTATLTITPVNDVPTLSSLANQSITTGSSTGDLTFTVGDVETAAGSLTVTVTSSNTALVPNDPSHLILGGAGANRTLRVVPVPNANGSTTLTLSVSDGSATTSTTLTVDVTGPVAQDVTLETAEDTPLEVRLQASGDGALTFSLVTAPEHGTLSELSAEGVALYTPSANYHGQDALTFRVTDLKSQSTQGTVTLTITPVNDVPTLSSLADQTLSGNSSTGDLAFTVGDVETAAASLTVTVTSSNTTLVPNDPSHLVLGGAGANRTLRVIPIASASGSTLLTLSVSDGSATTSTTFTLDVIGPPVAQNATLETAEDTALEVRLQASGTGALSFSLVAAPTHGTLSALSTEGVATYTPNANYHGQDALTFRVTDPRGQSAQGTVTLTITPVNDVPTLSSLANQTISGNSSTGDLAFTVGDVETAAASLTVTVTSSNTGLVPNDPSHLVLGGTGANRTLRVIPIASADGSTLLTLSVNDGSATTSTTFTLDVIAPPVAQNATLETAEDTALEVRLQASGTGTLTFSLVTAPEHGTLSALSAEGVATYTPGANYHGQDAFTFRVTDPRGQSAQGTVTLTISPVNDPPTLSSLANQSIPEGSSTGDLAFTVGDVETAAASLTVTVTSSNSALVPNDPSHLVLGGSGASRTLRVVPIASAIGSTLLTLSVSDGASTTSTTFTLDVTGLARLYWMTAAGSLWRVGVSGTNAVELKTGISGSGIIASDPVTRTLFYSSGSALVRVDSDGANPVEVVANGGYPSGLAVDSTNRKLYWSDFNGSRVMRAELDGSNPTQVIGGINSPSALAFDVPRGKVYVITYNSTRIVRFNLDGTNLETIASNLGGLGVGLALDSSGGKVYYSTRGNSIYVIDLDGSNATPLVTNQNTAHGIAIDVSAGRLYWADWLGQAIRSAQLADGGDIQNLNSGSSRNLGLAWMPAP